MATFVAPVTPLPKSEQIESARRRRERAFAVLLVSALTLFALAVGGYHPYAEDGGLYMAGVKRLLDPAMYPHETAFVLEPMRLSHFAPAVAGLVRVVRITPDARLDRALPVLLLALHLASVWATLFGAWQLSTRCWTTRHARTGAVVLLACWLDLPVAGTALLLMDPYVTARSLSTPLMVLALVGALDMTQPRGTDAEHEWRQRRGLLVWAGSIVLAWAMHPLMAAYAFEASLMLVCMRSSVRSVQVAGTAALAGTAIGVAALLQAMARPESADYLRVAMTRTYWFPAAWKWYESAGLAAPLLLLMLSGMRSNRGGPILGWETAQDLPAQAEQARRSLARMAVVVGATAWIVALLFARVGAATHLVARMQPLRAFQIVYLVMVMVLGATLGERVLRHVAWRWCAAMLLLGGAMLAVERTAFPNSSHLEMPGIWTRNDAQNDWVRAFLWIRRNTPKNALFALDADYINAPGEDAQCFRAIAERSALPDYSKDGGEASIAPELTSAWVTGQGAQQGLSAPAKSDAERVAALAPLGVSWVVLEAEAVTSFDCPYKNAGVRVCRLR